MKKATIGQEKKDTWMRKGGRKNTEEEQGKAGNEEESRVTNQSVICKQRQQSSGEMARDTSQLTTLSVTNYERVESEDSKKNPGKCLEEEKECTGLLYNVS